MCTNYARDESEICVCGWGWDVNVPAAYINYTFVVYANKYLLSLSLFAFASCIMFAVHVQAHNACVYVSTDYLLYNLLRRPTVQPTCLPTYTFRSEPTSTFHLLCVYHTLYTMRKYTHIRIHSYTETRSRRESTSKLWGGHRPERSIKLLLLLLLMLFCLLPFCVYGIRMVGAIATHTQQQQHSKHIHKTHTHKTTPYNAFELFEYQARPPGQCCLYCYCCCCDVARAEGV